MVREFDWCSNAAGRAVDTVGYGTWRRDVDGAVGERGAIHGRSHYVFKADDDSQYCAKSRVRKQKHCCVSECSVTNTGDCAFVGRGVKRIEKSEFRRIEMHL